MVESVQEVTPLTINQVSAGMTVWVYPWQGKRRGSVVEKVVQSVNSNRVRFVGGIHAVSIHGGQKIYRTREDAVSQQQKDRAEPKWMDRGRFRTSCAPHVRDYLAHKTGISPDNIDVKKTPVFLHVCYVSKCGQLHKHKQRCGNYYEIEENDLAELVSKMSV
jgi:hypothetical protein